jgi:hypothetical protein
MKLLERKLDRRYQTALDMIRDLSLAAGSTAWGRDRCAELVRNSFSSRQSEIEKLVVRIPNRAQAPAYPEGRTIVQKGPVPQAQNINDTDSGARTLVGAQPLVGSSRIPLTTEPGREPATDPGRPAVRIEPPPKQATPQPQPVTSPAQREMGLSAKELFDDEPPSEERTRIIPGQSMRGLPRVEQPAREPSLTEQPTDPRRGAVPRQQSGGTSNTTLIVAAIIALVLGAVGGAFIIQKMQQPGPAAGALVRLTLSSDRPATVFLGKQELGATPVTVFVPSGKHQLVLQEADGPKRSLEVNLSPSEPDAKMVVTLDSLPQLP